MASVKKLVVVPTCERSGGVSYLRDTLRALGPLPESARGVVLSDGPLRGGFDGPGWEVRTSAERAGSRRNMWRALKLFVESGADELLYVEDDAAPVPGALARALSTPVPEGAAFMSLYDGSALEEGAPAGLHWRHCLGPARTGFWGTVALKFPRRTAEWLLKRDPVADAPRWSGEACGSDAALGNLLALSPWPEYAVHCPTLFGHRGEVSAAHPGETLREHRTGRNLYGGAVADLNLSSGFSARDLPPVGSPQFPDHGSLSLAIVLPTFNRFELLKKSVESIRTTLQGRWVTIVAVDGGSADGSRGWLAEQPDVLLVGDRGPLDGAVRAFNLGFRAALETGAEFVGHFNDDAVAEDSGMWADAVVALRADLTAGAAAFKFDLRGRHNWEYVHGGRPYVNFGVVRAAAMKRVSLATVGHPTAGYWNPVYRTYGADAEAGCWLWRLGYKILKAEGRVHDVSHQDGLRNLNTVGQQDSALFWSRWPQESVEDASVGPAMHPAFWYQRRAEAQAADVANVDKKRRFYTAFDAQSEGDDR